VAPKRKEPRLRDAVGQARSKIQIPNSKALDAAKQDAGQVSVPTHKKNSTIKTVLFFKTLLLITLSAHLARKVRKVGSRLSIWLSSFRVPRASFASIYGANRAKQGYDDASNVHDTL